jgi:large subunit ribosomal protein L10
MTVGLNRSEKAVVIEEVTAKVASAKSIVLAQYRGLEVGHITGLRKEARKSGVYLRVLKNSLARRAVADSPFSGLADQMVGPLIYGISDDPVAAAKVISDFAKTNDKLVVMGGSLPNSVFDAAGVKALATMPSREELLAKLLGTMQAPIAQFVRTLNEVPTKFVRGLAAVRDQKESAQPSSAPAEAAEAVAEVAAPEEAAAA